MQVVVGENTQQRQAVIPTWAKINSPGKNIFENKLNKSQRKAIEEQFNKTFNSTPSGTGTRPPAGG